MERKYQMLAIMWGGRILMGVYIIWASLVAKMVKNLPAVQEMWVQFLGQEDPLEKEMSTHSRILAWRIPGMGQPGGLPSLGLHRVEHD